MAQIRPRNGTFNSKLKTTPNLGPLFGSQPGNLCLGKYNTSRNLSKLLLSLNLYSQIRPWFGKSRLYMKHKTKPRRRLENELLQRHLPGVKSVQLGPARSAFRVPGQGQLRKLLHGKMILLLI